MKIAEAIERLKHRKAYLQSVIDNNGTPHVSVLRAEIGAIGVAIGCMELAAEYCYVSVKYGVGEVSGPLIRGQRGVPAYWPPIGPHNKHYEGPKMLSIEKGERDLTDPPS